jgi:pyridoxine/pyridoxamine 5'-phosphate oxidase
VSWVAEAWSLPWHELQRRLAVSAETSTVKESGLAAAPFKSRGPYLSPSSSWLARSQAAPLGALRIAK